MDGTAGGSTRDRLGLWLGAALVLASVLVLQALGTYAFHVDVVVRILCASIIGVLLVVWAVAAIVRPAFRPQTVLAGPLVLAMLAFGASVLGSQRPRLSLEPALIGVASGLTLLMLTSLLRNATVRRIVAVMVLLLPIVISLLYMGTVLIEWIRWWTLIGRLAAPPLRPSFADLALGSPNLVATYLIIFAPLSAVLAARRFGIRIAILVLGLAGTAVFLTGSRSGYVGIAVSGLVAAFLGRAAIMAAVRAAASRLGGGWLPLKVAAIVGPVALGVILVGPGLASRLTLSGADYRSWFWRSALELFEASPITGTGPGTWAQLKLATVLATEVNAVVPHAHNLFFQTITEVGLLGMLGLLLFGGAVLLRSRHVHRHVDRWTRIEVVAVLGALAGLLAQQITDYLMNLPAVMLGAGLLIAWVDGAPGGVARDAGPIARRSASLSRPAAIVLGAVLLVALPMLGRVASAMVAAERANLTAASGDWAGALAAYDRAIAEDPDFTLYGIERANALAHLGRLEEARDAYAAVVDDDLLPQNVIALAAIELETGNPVRAAALAHVALARGWRDPIVTLNAGRILEVVGDLAVATEAYAAAVRWNPALASSTYWAAPGRRISLGEIVDGARAMAFEADSTRTAAFISAYAGRMEEARHDASSISDNSSRVMVSAVLDSIDGDRASAITALRVLANAAPGDFDTVILLARLLQVEGDPDAARYSALATILRADEVGTNLVELSTVPAAGNDRYLGQRAGYPFAVYARRGPLDPWPPLVLVIGPTRPS